MTDLFGNVTVKRINIRLFLFVGTMYYIFNPPRNQSYLPWPLSIESITLRLPAYATNCNFSVFEVSPAWNYIFSDVCHLCKKWIKTYFKVKLTSVVLDI